MTAKATRAAAAATSAKLALFLASLAGLALGLVYLVNRFG